MLDAASEQQKAAEQALRSTYIMVSDGFEICLRYPVPYLAIQGIWDHDTGNYFSLLECILETSGGTEGGLALRWVDVKELKSSYHDLERSQHHSVSVLEQPSRYAKKARPAQLLVSPLITPILVPYIIPYRTPFKEFRL